MNTVYNKNCGTVPPGAVYIGRGSPYGNPYVIGKDGTRDEVIDKYRLYVYRNPELAAKVRLELRDKDLVCFCAPRPCHGDFLLQLANCLYPK